jgi:hypothetical protein
MSIVYQSNSKHVLFEHESLAVLQRLRAAVLTLIEALPGPPRRAADVERALGLSTKLAWQVHRIAYSTNPLAETDQVPGIAGMRQVLKAAAKAGVPQASIDAVTEAMDAFEDLVQTHADDRIMFTSMAGSILEPRPDLLDLKVRREYFRLASRVWGTQSKISLRTSLYVPGKRSEFMDGVNIRGAAGVLRLRPDATLHLTSNLYHPTGDGKALNLQILTAQNGNTASELLTPFCTQPLPALVHRRVGNDLITELQDQPLGKRGAFTYFVADSVRDFEWPDPPPAESSIFEANVAIARPTEVLMADVMFYDGMFGSLKPTAAVYGNLSRLGVYQHWQRTERDRLPMDVKVESLGFGAAAMRPAEFPGGRYAEMIQHICQRMDLDPEKFEVFRCRVEYPILHSLLSITFQLPRRGNW